MNARRAYWLAILLTLAAFALRCADMTARSLWIDESFTLLRIEGSWAQNLSNTIIRQGIVTTDLHPQLYFVLIKLWVAAAGASDFSLRLLSVLWSVLTLPLAIVLAKRLHSRAAGLLAGVFLLTCPATQWYGWEVRNYAMAEALGALSAYLALRWLHGRSNQRARRRVGLAWLLTALAGLFTHYTFVGFIAGQALAVLPALVRHTREALAAPGFRRRALLAVAALVGLAIGLSLTGFGASLLNAFAVHVAPALRQPAGALTNPLAIVYDIAASMQFGLSAADPTFGALNAVLLLMCGLGLILMRRRAAALSGAIAASVLMWWALVIFIPNDPTFRYFIPLVALIYAAAAAGLLEIGRRAMARASLPRSLAVLTALSGAALIVGPHTHGLIQTFTRKATFQDDWPALSAHLRDNWRPGDALLINIFTPEAILRRQLKGLPIDMLSFDELNHARGADALTPAGLKQRYKRVWVARTGGAVNAEDIAHWLPDSPVAQSIRFSSRTNVLQLDAHPIESGLSAEVPAGQAPLAAAALGAQPAQPAQPAQLAAWRIVPGNPYNKTANFQLRASWRRAAGAGPLTEPLRLRIRLRTGARVRHTVDVAAQLDFAPRAWGSNGAPLYTTDYVVPLPPGLPDLPYTLEIDVLAGEKAAVVQTVSVALDSGTSACCVVLPGAAGPDLFAAADVALAGAEYPERVRIGQALPVALNWRRLSDAAQPWRTRLALAPLIGAEVAASETDTGAGDYPLAAWPLGHWVRDTLSLQLPFTVQPGVYRLTLARYRGDAMLDRTTLGWVWVEAYPPSPVPTGATLPLQASAGEMTLLGLRLPEPRRGATIAIATLWRVDRAPQRDGVLFLHLINPDGTPGPQDDNPPESGARSTLSYRAGDGIDQPHLITLPADAPPGEYKIYVGVYNRADQQRWEALQNGAPATDNLIFAGSFRLD